MLVGDCQTSGNCVGHAEINLGDGGSNTGGLTWPQKQMDIMMLQQPNATLQMQDNAMYS